MRLYGVRKLSERDGQFYVHIRCYVCQRRGCFLARDLQARLPMRLRMDADLDTVKERFYCEACKRRTSPAVWSMSDPMEDPS